MKHPTMDVVTEATVTVMYQPGVAGRAGADGVQLMFSGQVGQRYINSLIEQLREAHRALGG